jgi:Uma2 family endonuclease
MSAIPKPETLPPDPFAQIGVMAPFGEPAPLEEILPNVELIEEDGVPTESPWHYYQLCLLIAVLTYRWRDRTDFYVGGNMFIYYSTAQARSIKADPVGTTAFKGPDFFYVAGVNREPLRRYWEVWEEGGRYPDLIMEFLSPSTAKEDLGSKKDFYERVFRTREYFCFDPDTGDLLGWRLNERGRYRVIKPDERGWLWSEELESWLGLWEGTYMGSERRWLRLYDTDRRLLPLPDEDERQQKEAARRQAKVAKGQAKTARKQAKAAEERAEAAEAETARLKARLAELEEKTSSGKSKKRS